MEIAEIEAALMSGSAWLSSWFSWAMVLELAQALSGLAAAVALYLTYTDRRAKVTPKLHFHIREGNLLLENLGEGRAYQIELDFLPPTMTVSTSTKTFGVALPAKRRIEGSFVGDLVGGVSTQYLHLDIPLARSAAILWDESGLPSTWHPALMELRNPVMQVTIIATYAQVTALTVRQKKAFKARVKVRPRFDKPGPDEVRSGFTFTFIEIEPVRGREARRAITMHKGLLQSAIRAGKH